MPSREHLIHVRKGHSTRLQKRSIEGREKRDQEKTSPTAMLQHPGPGAPGRTSAEMLQLQGMLGNRRVNQIMAAAQRQPGAAAQHAVQREGEEQGAQQAPAPQQETWGQWMSRHKWKIAGGLAVATVAGLYLYHQSKSGGEGGGGAEAVKETAGKAAEMAQQGLRSGSVEAVEQAVENAPRLVQLLPEFANRTLDATVEQVADVLAGSSLPSMAHATMKALEAGMDAAEAANAVIVDPTHIGFG